MSNEIARSKAKIALEKAKQILKVKRSLSASGENKNEVIEEFTNSSTNSVQNDNDFSSESEFENEEGKNEIKIEDPDQFSSESDSEITIEKESLAAAQDDKAIKKDDVFSSESDDDEPEEHDFSTDIEEITIIDEIKVKPTYESQNPKPHKCPIESCGKEFRTVNSLIAHKKKFKHYKKRSGGISIYDRKKLKGPFKCNYENCEHKNSTKQGLKLHIQRIHTKETNYVCESCDKKFYSKTKLRLHKAQHHGLIGEALKCRYGCDASFTSHIIRLRHERKTHIGVNPEAVECDICGKPCNTKGLLISHKRTHLGPSERIKYQCSYCGKQFADLKYYRRHEKEHQENEILICEYENCHYKTIHKSDLNCHVKKKHGTKMKDFACHLCSKSYETLSKLRKHLKNAHSSNFRCDQCDKTFLKEGPYERHMKTHRDRSCHLCNYKSNRVQNVSNHLMSVHKLTYEELIKLGRVNPKEDTKFINGVPEYLVRWKEKQRERNKQKSKKSKQIETFEGTNKTTKDFEEVIIPESTNNEGSYLIKNIQVPDNATDTNVPEQDWIHVENFDQANAGTQFFN